MGKRLPQLCYIKMKISYDLGFIAIRSRHSNVMMPVRFLFIFVPGGALPYKRLMGMCRWMGSHFHDWIDHNGVPFSIVTRMGSHIFGFLG